MISVADQIAQVEQSIQAAKDTVAFGESLTRLFSNRDFKKVILDGYFKDEAVRLVHLLSDPNTQSPESQVSLQKQMHAIASLRDYLRLIEQRTSQALKGIAFDEQMLEELTAGDGHGN